MPRKKDPNTNETKPCLTCGINFESPKIRKRVFCSKKCSSSNPIIKQKNRDGVKKTLLKNYGGHHMQCNVGKESLKKSLLEKYGVDHYSKHPDYINKVKSTKLERYGDENYNNLEKCESTLLERYGVDNAAKVEAFKKKENQTRRDNNYHKIISILKKEKLTELFQISDYKGYNWKNKYPVKCNVCDLTFYITAYNTNNIFCEKCNPYRMKAENELFLFLSEATKEIIARRDREILSGKELDFYIPTKKIALEYNGIYWHSEIGGKKNKVYHLNKLKKCIINGITLLQIQSDDWQNKTEIIKSIINNKLGNISNKIGARKCVIKEVDNIDSSTFLENNDLNGEDKSGVKLGLYYKDELVSLMTLCKSKFNQQIEWEVSRYCCKLNTIIIGGISKIFKHFIKNYNPNSVVSFSDRRFFTGEVYSKLGFVFFDNTLPRYYYTDDYKEAYPKMYFTKNKLKDIVNNFDENLSEWENMRNNNWDRIWDCGDSKWIWNNPISQ